MWILFGCSSVVICVVTCCVLIFGILCSFGALRQYWNRRTWPLTQQIMPPPSHKNWNVCSCVCIMRNCADSLETGKLQYPTVAPLISFYNRVQRIIQTNRPYIYISLHTHIQLSYWTKLSYLTNLSYWMKLSYWTTKHLSYGRIAKITRCGSQNGGFIRRYIKGW